MNVFLVDSYANSVDSVTNLINNSSTAKEKLVLNLENI
jgi:hypothetical protein